MTLKQKEIIIKSLSWFLSLFFIIFVGVNNVFGATISDYAVKYYWYVSNDNSSITSTDYRSGSDNKVTLYGATAPTYDNGEGFNGFYIRVNNSLTKGSIYTLSLTVSYNSLQSSEFSSYYVNNRLLNTDFAHCSSCTITSVSGFIRTYNSTNQAISGLYDYVVHMNYTFVATADVNQFYIGSYTGDDRTIGLDNHLYTSTIIVANLDLSNDNNSTIINQNDTIIEQNNQIIDQNEQNTQDIINNQNQNAQDIINNQNSNTQQQIQSQQVCTLYDKSDIEYDEKYLDNLGRLSNFAPLGVSYFIDINNSVITPLKVLNNSSAYYCFYKSDKSLILCNNMTTMVANSILSIPDNSSYIRFTINKSQNAPQLKICKNGNQAISQQNEEAEKTRKGILGKLGDIFSTLFSDDDADVSGLDNMVGWLPPGPVDSIINLPLSLFNSLTNTLSGTCTPVTLTLPFVNKTLTLPCFDAFMSQYLTGFSTLWNWIGITVSVFILYRYLLSLYKWIDDTLTLRENNLPGYYDDNMWGGA